MILVDTTVLVYGVGADHPLRDPARAFITAFRDGTLHGVTTVEVIQEFAHVRARRRDRDDAAALAGAYADLLSPLQSPSGESLKVGLDLWKAVPTLGSFDSVLAALALTSDLPLVSADRAFGDVPGLRWWDLAAGPDRTP